ncbi:MAG: glutaminyl-tRNA synthase (glutamine-hydrolyzing) subunit A [Candidatus Lloydbacteria bacterium RIFCSPLOWO2_01_FULL_50_20]|uniref:Glutamyl-tRNA(Gln) amidotransferase subunit A n=1 Tax=Candidatus Lloydbacteria bacterium RIFCSPLOWO2_01_FULL_50_20 TaxID=1798665 RepID=A0A1G2DEH4_9BACT|nr:MAG: glutaminyl-tRNA synthase (glutamine-hydrolyzing) subunit A [Candidatus Lloydbacteria bacterium RIFCSPLOWO2_01_FULL_50_20]
MLTIAAAQRALRNKEYSAKELTQAVVSRAKEKNPDINAYAELFDDAMASAEVADRMLSEGKAAPLAGIPLGVKDNMLMKGKISASGSKILMNHRAVYDATVIGKLRSAGAVIVGRTNMDEFAMGSSSETCAYGAVKNPIDISRVPGGSSGGSAAAVAMGGALGALGSDTGGSIRQPAAHCGVVGMKPTYGRVSRYGLMALASSLDQIGPFAKTVEDAEILYQAIEGHDPMDSTALTEKHESEKGEQKEKFTIGIPESFIAMDGIDEDVRENFRLIIEKLKGEGHEVKTVSLPSLPHALPVYYIIMPAEVSANLARYDGIRYGFSKEADTLMEVYRQSRGEGFGKEARRRILLGTYVLSAGYYDAYYNKAVAVRRLITEELMRTFSDVDLIATPTTPSPAFKLGEKMTDPLKMYLEDIFTVPANIAGIPGISVPSGTVLRDQTTLPVGIQFMAAPFSEDALFAIGKDVENVRI